MTIVLALVSLWSLAAVAAALAPARMHWPLVWALIATGIPLLGLVTMITGPLGGMAGLMVASGLFWGAVQARREEV